MTDKQRNPGNAEIEHLLREAAGRMAIPAMADAVPDAVARIAANRSTAQSVDSSPTSVASRELWVDEVAVGGSATEPTGLLDRSKSRRREVALLAGGLAAAAVLVLVLVFAFGGLPTSDDIGPENQAAGAPPAAEPFDIPGYAFVRSIGGPQVPNQPIDVAVGKGGTRYVVDAGIDRVVAFTPDGQIDEDWGDRGFTIQLNTPIRAALDADGNLYVIEQRANRIQKLGPDGQPLTNWQMLPSAEKQTNMPIGIAVDSSGVVYVARSTNSDIEKYSPTGESLGQILTEQPTAMTIDDQDRLYVTYQSGGLDIIDTDGNLLGPPGNVPGPSSPVHLQKPAGIAVDAEGNIFVLQSALDTETIWTVVELDSDGNQLDEWETGLRLAVIDPLFTSATIAIQPDGNLIVPDPYNRAVRIFTASGESADVVAADQPGTFGNLYRIDADSQGNIYALDQSQPFAVTGFSPQGELLTRFQATEINMLSPGINPFIDSAGFSIGASDEVYIAERHLASNVYRYTTDGTLLNSWGGVSFEESGIQFPSAVAIAPDGSLYLLDDSSVVKHFTPDGHFIESFGDVGSERKDIVYAAGAVWTLTDGVVTRFDPETGEGTVIGRSASSEAGGQIPATGFAMDVDADGNIYIIGVAPSTGAEELFDLYYVQLDPTGEVIASQNLGPTFDRYIDVAIGPDGTFYLADSQSKQIFVYEPAS